MVVILIAIPLGHYFDLEHAHQYLVNGHEYNIGPKFLVTLPENILEGFTFPDFSHIFSAVSIKYIVMFALVGSLESLLSTKAIDILDPHKRKSNLNKDLVGVGIGNTIAGFVGGLPMITEIVRSSANVNNVAKTKWSNFFHGMFLLLFVALAPGLIHQIPLAALGAMLVYTGFRLAAPKVFLETYRVGKEQLAIFVSTLIVTLASDLIIGIFSGILLKFIFHLFRGAPLSSLFTSRVTILKGPDGAYTLGLRDSAIFSNFLGLKKVLDSIPAGNKIKLDFGDVKVVDHTVMEHLHHYGEDYERAGGKIVIQGMEKLTPLSRHPLACRTLPKESTNAKIADPRTKQMMELARQLQFQFTGSRDVGSNFGKFSSSPVRVKYEANVIHGRIGEHIYTVSDLSVVHGGNMKAKIHQITTLSISNLHLGIPIFSMTKEDIWDKVLEKAFLDDIDFKYHPKFSAKYKLSGIKEKEIRSFFTSPLITFFERYPTYQIESLGAELIIYKTDQLLNPEEIQEMISYGKAIIDTISFKAVEEKPKLKISYPENEVNQEPLLTYTRDRSV